MKQLNYTKKKVTHLPLLFYQTDKKTIVVIYQGERS
jgi:hypothetical protein